MNKKKSILSINNLSVSFPLYKGIFRRKFDFIKVLNNINLNIEQGEILGIAGESGCGKTTLAKTIMGLIKFLQKDVLVTGEILFHQNENMTSLLQLSKRKLNVIKAEMQMIFQDPFSSLNPRMTIYDILNEPLHVHNKKLSFKDKDNKLMTLIDNTGISKEQLGRYPHEFSGGQRQRIAIARALMLHPRLIIADEPVSALDVSIQAQILNLLSDLQEKYNLTYIFISHDLAVMKHIASKIAIMYLGEIIEKGLTNEIFDKPKHPYTKLLINSIPEINLEKKGERFLVPDTEINIQERKGCPFFSRCNIAKDNCKLLRPNMEKISETHFVKCTYYDN